MAILDLQKAFDTVDHSILLMKLRAMGFSELTLNWVQSYLSNHTKMIDVNGTLSESRIMGFGVPQGSIQSLYPFYYI